MRSDGSEPPHQADIGTVIRLEEEAEKDRSAPERLSEAIGRFAGRIAFVVCQIVFVAVWLLVNLGYIDGLRPFDPFPFPLLSTGFGLECVLLTAFVLIRQNRMSARADQRNHLALQVTLLSEKETTKIIQMLERMSRQMGIEGKVTDAESRTLGEATSIETIARNLRDTIETRIQITLCKSSLASQWLVIDPG